MAGQPFMTAASVMTRNVAAVHPDTPLLAAVQLMAKRRVSGMPVVDDARHVIGMISEGDLVRWHEGLSEKQTRWLDLLAKGNELAKDFLDAVTLEHHKVKTVMARGAVSVTENTPLKQIAALMITKRIKRVPVVRDDRLVGIVARSDLVRALADTLSGQSGGACP